MSSLAKKAALVTLLLGSVAAPARSQLETYNFDSYCSMGSYMVCASVRIRSDGNTLTMEVWNLNGSLGVQHTITSIGLYHVATDWTGKVKSNNVTYVTGSGTTDISKYWTANGAGDIQNLGGLKIELADGTNGNRGIIGCKDPGGQIKWATCWNNNSSFDRLGDTPADSLPYVKFQFTLSKHFALNDLQLRWHSQQLPNGSSVKCDTGGAGDYPACRYHPPTTVPEPGTIALVGTGLVSVAGFVRRRRKTA